jgi:hypothetical protein
MNTLVAGQCYTVKDGSLKGIMGSCFEQLGCEGKTVHVLQSPDFQVLGISFCGALHNSGKQPERRSPILEGDHTPIKLELAAHSALTAALLAVWTEKA